VPEGSPVKLTVGDVEGPPLELTRVDKPLLERAIAQAKIAGLLERQGIEGDKPETQKKIVALSVGYRVLSPYTGLLVLETERDYARFDIDRESAADVPLDRFAAASRSRADRHCRNPRARRSRPRRLPLRTRARVAPS